MTSARLVFRFPFTGGVRLVFGRSTAPSAEVFSAAGHVPEDAGHVAGVVHVAFAATGHVPAALEPAQGAASYDANVSRSLGSATQARWQDARAMAPAALQAHWQDAMRVTGRARTRWHDARAMRAHVRDRMQDTRRLHARTAPRWQDATPLRRAVADAFQHGIPVHRSTDQSWQDAMTLRVGLLARMQDMLRAVALRTQHWQAATPVALPTVLSQGYGLPFATGWHAHWQDARRPPLGMYRPDGGEKPHQCFDPATVGRLVFRRLATEQHGRLIFKCYIHVDPPEPEPPALIVVPVRRTYVTVNSLHLRRVDGNIPIPCEAFSLSLDRDSWTFQWSGTVRRESMSALEPAYFGEPVELEAVINGTAFRLQCESRTRSRQFAQTRVEISGRGLAAALDAPYASEQHFTNLVDRTAEQLMGDILMDNGVGIGWDVDFGLDDWLVPAGAFSHQGTYVSAINAIAQAAGGYVQPHRTAQTLRILHAYPVAPWNWASEVTPDIELPQDVVAVEGVEWLAKPAYHRVYVSGTTQGVLGQVTRRGTSGNLHAPMVTDSLITHATTAAQRGRAELSDTGAQALVSLSMPVLQDTGILLPGQFVRRVDAANSETLQGYVRSMSVDWSFPRLRQTLEVQCHE